MSQPTRPRFVKVASSSYKVIVDGQEIGVVKSQANRYARWWVAEDTDGVEVARRFKRGLAADALIAAWA